MKKLSKKSKRKSSKKPIVILRKKAGRTPTPAKIVKKAPPAPPPPKKIELPPPPKNKTPVDNIPFFFKKYVYKHIEQILPPPPWAVGIRKEVEKRLLPLEEYEGKKTKVRKLINWKLKVMTKNYRYLQLLIDSDIRHGFDGVTMPVEAKHKLLAKKLIDKKLNQNK